MENKYFAQALSNFTFDVAARGAIRHLADLGQDAEGIRKQLLYPVPIERIREELRIYEEEKAAAKEGAPKVRYVKDTSPEGKVSFRRVEE